MRLPRTKRHAFFGAFHTSHSYGLPLDLWSLRHFEEPMSGPPWDFAALLLPLLRQHTCSCAFVLPPLYKEEGRTNGNVHGKNKRDLSVQPTTNPSLGGELHPTCPLLESPPGGRGQRICPLGSFRPSVATCQPTARRALCWRKASARLAPVGPLATGRAAGKMTCAVFV